ncbi:peptidyl-prolyl cis-trans isomerase [Allgaiera indica]|uniref:Parvulin-like PPIase n=1 Tax=Allgaiera indica TaxID=765699 RepID=A0AAN4URG2_9RHOB|nr:peptidyl-prolyl cis-trans isomerase [Allgaiera indica]GHE01310.1 peptidyl-prolyl cis-trans isomerase [Allgaiera indica]SDW84512.1 peptidyl-prolyl cis-trans isomerase D [Allgaiera indica]
MASRKTRDKTEKAPRGDEERRPRKGASVISWILLGMVVLGLGGYGITNFGGSATTVASVGGTKISVDDYGRAVRNALRAMSAQSGKNITFQEAQKQGLDQQVLQQLVLQAALDDEDSRVGISVGDGRLRQDITAISAFQGADGKFSAQTYKFVLQQNGLKEGEFEAETRKQMARTILQDAVTQGFGTPTTFIDTIMHYVGARRGFEILKLGADDLAQPVPAPTEAQLQAYYKAHPKTYTSLPAKRITYAELLPDQVAKTMKIPEAKLKAYYDQHKSDYVKPERRLVERLVYPAEAAAKAARAKLDAGQATFDQLVKERGLTLSDIDLGDVTADELSSAAAKQVFAAKQGAIVGPVESSVGPALFRVNNIIAAQTTSFDAAKTDIRNELGHQEAKQKIQSQEEHLNDLLAGGATLEQLAKETDMTLGTIDFTAKSATGIAGYEAFRDAARKVTKSDYPSIIQLDDGGIVALRLDKPIPAEVQPFAKVKDKVAEDWTRDQTDKALMALAQTDIKTAQAAGGDLSKAGTVDVQEPITRSGYIDNAPPGLLEDVFMMKKGETKAFQGDESVWIVKLTQVLPPAQNDPDIKKMRDQIAGQGAQGMQNDAFLYFAQAIQAHQGININQSAINAVNAQLQ